jgi:hypothetical protein
MKKSILAILWAASLVCAYYAGRAVSGSHDYSPPESLKAEFEEVQQLWTNVWPNGAHIQLLGKFVLISPRDESQAALRIGVLGRPHYPYVCIDDDSKSGRPDTFVLCDGSTNTIHAFDKDRDGIFDKVGMVTTNGYYSDKGLTGTWRVSKGPSK